MSKMNAGQSGSYINPTRAGFQGNDAMHDRAVREWAGTDCYKSGGAVKSKMHGGPMKKAIGGVAKIRLGQSTSAGKQKSLPRRMSNR